MQMAEYKGLKAYGDSGFASVRKPVEHIAGQYVHYDILLDEALSHVKNKAVRDDIYNRSLPARGGRLQVPERPKEFMWSKVYPTKEEMRYCRVVIQSR